MNHFYKRSPEYYPVEEDSDSGEHNPDPNEKQRNYIRQLLVEKSLIDEKDCPHAYKYISGEIHKAQQNIVKGPPRDNRYLDLYNDVSTKVAVKVLFPIRQFPRYNFLGKILGPKGSTLRQLQTDTQCFMNIGGRGSMRDPEKEEALKKSLDPKYAHLSDELHIEISTIAKPAEAHTRIANALNVIDKYLTPSFATAEAEESDLPRKRSIFGKVTFSGEHMDDENSEERNPRGPNPGSAVMSILNRARVAMEETHKLEMRRQLPNIFAHAEYTNRPKRYEEKGSYGQYANEAMFKRRKQEEFN